MNDTKEQKYIQMDLSIFEADLVLLLRRKGYNVVYNPGSITIHVDRELNPVNAERREV